MRRSCLKVVAVLAGLMPLAAGAQNAPNPSFTLANRANQAINEIYATPAGVDRWGRDRLGQSSVPPGQSFPVRLPADGNCVYDIRVVYADGKPEEKRRLNTCQIETVAFPGGRAVAGSGGENAPRPNQGGNQGGNQATDDPSFRLVNRGRQAVNALYVSPPSAENWGRDRLGDDTIAAGGSQVIRLPQGDCTYDVRVVFANGEATERRRLNLCTINDLRVP